METFLKNFDADKLEKLDEEVTHNVSYLENIVSGVVKTYTAELDKIMCMIKTDVVDKTTPAPIEVIEKYFLELSNCLYFIGENSEKLGLYDSISKSIAKEAFNNNYMDSNFAIDDKGKKKTVAELTALAENATIYEQTLNDMYNKAYKVVKVKVAAGENMCSALSKILSRRMNELQLSSMQPATFTTTNRQILNEGEVFR